MKKYGLSVCGLCLALLAPSSMLADTIFNYSFMMTGVHGSPDILLSGSGQLDTLATSTPGAFLLEGVPGATFSCNSNLITISSGVADLGSCSISYTIPNIMANGATGSYATVALFAGSLEPVFPFPGNTIVTVNNLYTGPSFYGSEVGATYLNVTPASPATAATPEPGTFLLLATGGLGLIGRAYRTRNQA